MQSWFISMILFVSVSHMLRVKRRSQLPLKLPPSSPAKTPLPRSHPLIRPAQTPTVRTTTSCSVTVFLRVLARCYTSHTFLFLSVAAAVVSLNDSDELSSSSSEEEEDEEEEEEEDSGSEVEIIEEVEGNGRLPPLQPTSVFAPPGLSHFLPSMTEQQAAELPLMTPSTEMKVPPRTKTRYTNAEFCVIIW